MTDPAQFLAARLAHGLIHPGGPDQPAKALPVPTLAGAGIPPQMAEYFAAEAGFSSADTPKLIAEAIVHTLRTEGEFEIVGRAELTRLRTEVNTQDDSASSTTTRVHCRCNRNAALLVVNTGRARTAVDGAALRRRLDEVCTCRT